MCIGIPLQVVNGDDHAAECAAGERRERLNMLMVGAQPPGTWVLAFQGSALRVMTEDEALQTRAALAALEAALAGDATPQAFDHCFADLVQREPQLPPHLRSARPDPQPPAPEDVSR